MTGRMQDPVAGAPQQQLFPTGAQLVRAGLSGAAIAGTWTGIYEAMRVRNGEIGSDEAVQTTLNSAVIGAGAGAVAQLVGQVARSVPLLALAAAAAGVLYLVNQTPNHARPVEHEGEAK